MDKLRKLFRPKLKSCPFCGGEAQYIEGMTRDLFPEVYHTVKVGCHCGIYTRACIWVTDSDLQKVTDMWNRRVENDH